MLDWFVSGIFGGLFGPAIVRVLRRYKLRVIFIAGAFAAEVALFFSVVKIGGWHFAWQRMTEMAFTPIGILFPLGIGALCVVGLVLCAPELLGKKRTKQAKKGAFTRINQAATPVPAKQAVQAAAQQSTRTEPQTQDKTK